MGKLLKRAGKAAPALHKSASDLEWAQLDRIILIQHWSLMLSISERDRFLYTFLSVLSA